MQERRRPGRALPAPLLLPTLCLARDQTRSVPQRSVKFLRDVAAEITGNEGQLGNRRPKIV